MYNIGINKVITLNKGDTFEYKYKIDLGWDFNNRYHTYTSRYYTMQEGDHLYFALMQPNQVFEGAIVKKIYDVSDFEEDHVNIKLDSDDTWYLTDGKYYYTIKLERFLYTDEENNNHYEVITTQPNTLFFLV